MNRLLAVLIAFVTVAAAACSGAGSPSPSFSPGPSASPTVGPSATPGPSASAAPLGLIREVRADVARATPGSADELGAVVDADADFAFDLYARLIAGVEGDLFFSPYSISTALSMTYAGARGNTADELARALGVEGTPDAWHAGRNGLELDLATPAVPTPEGVVPLTLEAVNTLFGQDGFPFERLYLDTLARYYGAGLQVLDFVADPEASRAAINGWVAGRTRDRIPHLLGPGTITDMTRFVLVNAIYFKANWLEAFDPDFTTTEPFRLLDGSTIDVPTMHGVVEAGYADGDGWAVVRLRYLGASMLVVVPDEGRFADIEDGLNRAFLRGVEERLVPTMVTLALPRWESETAAELIPYLKALGIVDLFGAADLTGIAPAGLFVSHVIHQANVTVDEAGTEAAAATAVVGDVSGPPSEHATLTVDRPWIYAIQDDSTGELLFLGRVLEPSAG